ncbi:YggS family pyridoxal phosphate-dependent enzyme [Lentisphaerota bacterium WC36G]|nr:YggS family pyridoxal phosphate-dependent enzyme [Lentisphaerae bacterium WC36]
MQSVKHIKEQLNHIRQEVEISAKNASRDPKDITLVAVSKTFPNEYIEIAYNDNQRVFGENKTQELSIKVPNLPNDIEWHMIGHLQSNKVKQAVELASYIHSVDSLKLLRRIDRIAGELNKKPKIFIEVNISGETSKFGTTKDEVTEMVKEAIHCENLELIGYMTMAPFGVDEEELRFVFSSLRKLRDEINNQLSIELKELSMGMSNDFKIAIEEGATFVRVGSSIFGKRSYQV